jgi:hypothetical protein
MKGSSSELDTLPTPAHHSSRSAVSFCRHSCWRSIPAVPSSSGSSKKACCTSLSESALFRRALVKPWMHHHAQRAQHASRPFLNCCLTTRCDECRGLPGNKPSVFYGLPSFPPETPRPLSTCTVQPFTGHHYQLHTAATKYQSAHAPP